MYKGKTISIVLATYREKDSIKAVIGGFFNTGFVDEIIVVNNNAEPGTVEEVQKTDARMVYEKRQGYGYAFQRGIEEAKGDYIVLCEPDGTYTGKDLERFLVYAQDGFEAVLGSRTGQSTKISGADMDFLRKFSNVFEAKTIEYFFNTNSLSDIGCTYKLFTKEAFEKIASFWRTRNSLFATELVLLTAAKKLRFIEVPVTFKKRVGTSAFVSTFSKMAKWGLRIYAFIFVFWFRWIFRKIFLENK
ncbi:MAG: glycosyltransferase family 2 protein [Candidatus Azambacteria bacterium]|nr:glycosyltransferase family 2 protein [Candidatus Azambacteria bacterium]